MIPKSLDDFDGCDLCEVGEWISENAYLADNGLRTVLERIAEFLYAEGEER